VNADDVKRVVVEVLARIAPEVDATAIPPGANIREELDLDSMDFLNFVLGLHARLGVDIPEADYPRLYTLDSAVAYITARSPVT
jgi:acyl carrier protein